MDRNSLNDTQREHLSLSKTHSNTDNGKRVKERDSKCEKKNTKESIDSLVGVSGGLSADTSRALFQTFPFPSCIPISLPLPPSLSFFFSPIFGDYKNLRDRMFCRQAEHSKEAKESTASPTFFFSQRIFLHVL